MRTNTLALLVMVPAVLLGAMPTVTLAGGGRPASETCSNAGYRPGSPGFDVCVARVGGDDPLAALEGGVLAAPDETKDAGKPGDADTLAAPLAAIVPARHPLAGVGAPHPATREELPSSFNAPAVPVRNTPLPTPPASSPGTSPSGWWPTMPTAPTLPAPVPPNVPAWNFGSQ